VPFKVQERFNTRYVVCDPADFVIRNERDIQELISFCVEHDSQNVLIYKANFSPEFFDLKTTLAGTLLQKFANYHLRGVGLISLEQITDERFKELIFECNRGHLFQFYEDKAAAEKWFGSTGVCPTKVGLAGED
jgi:hypothetical protein